MKVLHLLSFCSLLLFVSCGKEPRPDIIPPSQLNADGFTKGHSFRQIGYNYADIEAGIQFVNPAPAIKTIDEQDGIKGEHWVYQSPSLNDRELGFSLVYSEDCLTQDCEVILFLHGSNGSENSGGVSLYNYYNNHHANENPVIMVFANGIYAPDVVNFKEGVWKLRENAGYTFNHSKQLIELISGLVSSSQFSFINKEMSKWSALGFSAGASAAVGVFMDPVFAKNPSYQPQHIYPLGGWMTNSLNDYFDFENGSVYWNSCEEYKTHLIIANHMADDVNCSGFTTYERASWLTDRLSQAKVPFVFLGLRDDVALCQPGDTGNPAHSISFYLKNGMEPAEKMISCDVMPEMNDFEKLGDMLY